MGDDSAFTGNERFLEETRDASPANLLIKCERFSLLTKYGIDKYESRVFEAGGYKWKMIIYPEGYKTANEEECYVSVHFTIAETDSLPVGWEVNAIFAFFVYNHHMDNYLCFRGTTRRFNALIPKCGFTKMILKKTLIDPSQGFLVDDSCVFGAEVFVIKNQCVNECLSLLKDNVPYKREWKIYGFSELEGVWRSEEFNVGDHKWKVTLYPKGCTSQSKDRYMSMFVKCVDAKNFASHQKVKAEVCMSIRTKLNYTRHSQKFNSWFPSSTRIQGIDEFISIVDMSSKGFLVDDCCYLEIEMTVQALVLDAPKIE